MLVKDIVSHLEAKRHTAVDRHFFKNQECADLLNESRPYIERIKESIVSVSIQRWINESCCANIAMNKCSLCKTKIMNPLEKKMCVSERFDSVCKGTDIFTMPVGKCGQQIYNYKRSMKIIRIQDESKLQR